MCRMQRGYHGHTASTASLEGERNKHTGEGNESRCCLERTVSIVTINSFALTIPNWIRCTQTDATNRCFPLCILPSGGGWGVGGSTGFISFIL